MRSYIATSTATEEDPKDPIANPENVGGIVGYTAYLRTRGEARTTPS